MLRGVAAQLIFIILMAMSFYALFALHINYRLNAYLKWLDVMMIVLTIYGLIPIIGDWSLYNKEFRLVETWISYYYLQRLYMSILPIYAFFYYFKRDNLSPKNLYCLFWGFLTFSILMYYQIFYSVSTELEMDEITNNAGFYFVPLIPLLHILKIKDIWKYLFLILILVYLVMSMKRGAILAGVVMSVLFVCRHLKTVSIINFAYILILSIGALWIVYLFAADQYAVSDYFQMRVGGTLSGDTSGRDLIYKSYWTFFIERTSAMEFLIGNGANATRVLLGQYAHNDWLEFAINQGVFGVVIYLIYWIFFVREWKYYRGNLEFRQMLIDLIVVYFLISLYSMSFEGMSFIATFCISLCLVNNMSSSEWFVKEKIESMILEEYDSESFSHHLHKE